jgi:NAD(P)-dependent dehydrogenase (short-subunit alcohol dehydrogenase family)
MSAETSITTPFGFDSTAAEVVAGIDLTGKRAIVTGGSSGIGIETAQALAAAGADVTLAVRNTEAGARVASEITATTGDAAVHVAELDLADPRSVAAFAVGWSGPLDILVNNAGVMAIPELELTDKGWELQFATNHLGHFALASGLHDALAEAPAGARIVSVSSRAHLRSPVVFDDVNFASRPYDPWLAYAQSKTANVLFAVEATHRWADEGITANAAHPGAIETNLVRHLDPAYVEQLRESGVYQYKTAEQGAATSVLAATSPLLEGVGGRYFQDCNEAPVVDPTSPEMSQEQYEEFVSTSSGVAAYALDPVNAERLWELSRASLLP